MKRNNFLIISGAVFFGLFQNIGYADTLDANSVTTIRQGIKSAYYEKCKETMSSTDQMCACLAAKVDEALSPAKLSQCTNDMNGTDCVTNVVKEATKAGMSDANITECATQSAQGGDAEKTKKESPLPAGATLPDMNIENILPQN